MAQVKSKSTRAAPRPRRTAKPSPKGAPLHALSVHGAQGKPNGSKRTTPRPRKAKPVEASNGLTAAEAREIVAESFDAAVKGVHAAAPATLGPLGSAQASPSDITDEMKKGGPGFGAFVKSVGLAVAAAQTELDANMVATAKKLSAEQIDVVAFFEQELSDDDGSMVKGVPQIQKLPLINYLMPTAYQWTRVFLQADMKVSEFNSANGFNIKSDASSLGVGASASYNRRQGLGVAANVSYGSSSLAAAGESSTSMDSAQGTMHMEAELKPRPEIQLPSPLILQKGPRLKLLLGSSEALLTGGTVAPSATGVTGKRVTITAELLKTLGTPHSGKDLDVTVDQPSLAFKKKQPNNATATNTDSDGRLIIEIDRNNAAFDPSKPLPTTVTVRFGLVSQTVGITL